MFDQKGFNPGYSTKDIQPEMLNQNILKQDLTKKN